MSPKENRSSSQQPAVVTLLILLFQALIILVVIQIVSFEVFLPPPTRIDDGSGRTSRIHVGINEESLKAAVGEVIAAPLVKDLREVLNRNSNSIRVDLPEWSRHFQPTQFTRHVLDIVTNLNREGSATTQGFAFDFLAHPNAIEVRGRSKIETLWTSWFQINFRNRTIPYNTTLIINTADSFVAAEDHKQSFLGNSSPKGRFCIPNKEEISHHLQLLTFRRKNKPVPPMRWPYDDTVPWEDRSPLPVFRGSPRGYTLEAYCQVNPNISYPELLKVLMGRYYAVDFSMDHPDLLDARFSGDTNRGCFRYKATNGLTKLLPEDSIPGDVYFSRYQAVLVLGGAGAAYRTARHLMTRTAVVLQDFTYEEWFTQYMTPWVHYIPLAQDFSNLNETLQWIRQNPKQVKTIADNGRQFYETYLTFQGNVEHMYELVYRLGEYDHYRSTKKKDNNNNARQMPKSG